MRIPLGELDIVNFGIELKSGGDAENYALFKLLYNNDTEMKRELFVLGVSEKYVKKWLYAFLIDPSTAIEDKALTYMRSLDPSARALSRAPLGSIPTHPTLGSSHFSGASHLQRPLFPPAGGSMMIEGASIDNENVLRIASHGGSPLARNHMVGVLAGDGEEFKRTGSDGSEGLNENTAAKLKLPLYGRRQGQNSPHDMSPRGAGSLSPARGASTERDKKKKTPRELID